MLCTAKAMPTGIVLRASSHAPSFRWAFALAESFRLKPGWIVSEVSIVRELRKGFVVARRIEPSNDVLHDEIADCGAVPHVEIERHEFLLEVQFRAVAKAGARIGLQAIAERPVHDVAERVVVEAGADARLIVDADIFVADGVAVDRANAEGDRAT